MSARGRRVAVAARRAGSARRSRRARPRRRRRSSPRCAARGRDRRRAARRARARRRPGRPAAGRSCSRPGRSRGRSRSRGRRSRASAPRSPARASTTSSAPSHACSERETSYVKSTCPGVSIRFSWWPFHVTRTACALIVIPRSRSRSIESSSCSRISPLRDGVGQLEDAVGERRLAVVDVRDDREVADAFLVHGIRPAGGGLAAIVARSARALAASGRTRGTRRPPTSDAAPSETSCAAERAAEHAGRARARSP